MATHSSALAWRIPGTGEPGGLPSMGSHRVGHESSDLAAAAGTIFIFEANDHFKLPRFLSCSLILPHFQHPFLVLEV